VVSEPEIARVELWVDAYAPAGGDGSRARPAKVLPPTVPQGALVHLASGLYRGPFTVGSGAHLRGVGVVVLWLEGPGTVVEVGSAQLENLSVQGGAVGVRARGRASLTRVTFSGFSQVGAVVEAGAALECSGCLIDGTIAGTDGVRSSGAVQLTSSRFTGGLAKGVHSSGGSVALMQVEGLGPRTLVSSLDTEVRLVDVRASGGQGPAFFVAGGSLHAARLTIEGHEYGLHASRTTVTVDGFVSRGSQCGLALTASRGSLAGVLVERSGALGGLQLLESTVRATDVQVRGAQALGVLVRKGRVELTTLRIEGVAREGGTASDPQLGDGLQVRDAEATVDDLEVRDVEGSALVVSNFARVKLGALRAERTGAAGVVVDVDGSLEARSVTLRGAHGPGALLLNRGHAQLALLEISGVDEAVWADCDTGAWAALDVLRGAREQAPSRCVRVGPAAR
jgi:hypothetical protein